MVAMSDVDARLDRYLHELGRRIGDLAGFEQEVARSIRSAGAGVGSDRPPLETLVGASIGKVDPRGRPRRLKRLAWSGAVAASITVLIGFFLWYQPSREVLASIGSGGGFEVRASGKKAWRRPAGPVDLVPGDEVRAVRERPISIKFRDGGDFLLHPGSGLLLIGGGSDTESRRYRTRLLYGGADVSVEPDSVMIVVQAGESACEVRQAQVQVRSQPDRGTIFVACQGSAVVQAGGARRPLRTGMGLYFVPGSGPAKSATPFRVDNEALAELIAGIRDRWNYYLTRETYRGRIDSIQVFLKRKRGQEKPAILGPGRAAPLIQSWVRRVVPFPGPDLREQARLFLAAHTGDDFEFVADSLAESVKIGLPDIAGRSVAALQLMGEPLKATEHRIEKAAPPRTGAGPKFARMAARAVLGQAPAHLRLEAALAVHEPLRTRALAVLAVHGLGDGTLVKRVFHLAQLSADDLYKDWQASTDFCAAVGLVLAGTEDGRAYAHDLIRDASLSVSARRRYLTGFSRALGHRTAEAQGFLLDLFPLLEEPKLERAAVMELLHLRPLVRDALVADFFEEIVDARGALAPLALTGLVLYAPQNRKAAVESRLVHLLESDPEPPLRAAAAQAFAPLGERRGFASRRVLKALESALHDAAPEARYWTARTLGILGRRSTLPVVLAAADRETDPHCLAALAHALVALPGANEDPEVTSLLVRRINENRPPFVKKELIRALGRLGTDLSRLILEDLGALGEDPEIRRAASEVLGLLRSEER